MEELAYDTLTEAKQLEAAGFNGRQAEAIVGTASRAAAINEQMAGDLIAIKSRTDAITARTDAITVQVDAITVQVDAIKARIDNEMATKDDLKDELKHFATKVDLADLRTEMAEGFGALRAELQECVAGLHRTIVFVMAGSFTAFAALLAALRIWG